MSVQTYEVFLAHIHMLTINFVNYQLFTRTKYHKINNKYRSRASTRQFLHPVIKEVQSARGSLGVERSRESGYEK